MNTQAVRPPLALRESADTRAAVALFDRVSSRLSDSCRLLERRVEELASELEQVDTARLRELEEKERLSDRLRGLLELLPGGVVVLDGHGIVCDCNPAARDMLQLDPAGERWVDVIRRCFAPRRDDGHEIALASGRRVSIATRSLGRELGQVVLLADQAQTRELRDCPSRDRRLNAMGRMMAALAHQVRTPLSAAMLYASTLCESDLTPAQTRRFAAKIRARLTHLEHQVRDMLIFVRDDVTLEDICSVRELLAQLAQASEAPLAEARASCGFDDGDTGALQLRCNREVLTGALLNLVSNALQAAGPGSRIGVRVVRHADRLRISVRDSGPGMSAAVLAQIEEEFFTTRPHGTGLGLAVARAVARAHGGVLEIRSAPGQGTSASLVLPLAEPAAKAGDAAHA